MTAAVLSPIATGHLASKFEPLEHAKDVLPSKPKTPDVSRPPLSPVDRHVKPGLVDSAPAAWNCATAKAAVTSMGIPEHIVQMAIDVQRLDFGRDFNDVGELFIAAETLICEPEVQARTVMKLYNASEEAKVEKARVEKAKAEKAKAEKAKAEKAKAEKVKAEKAKAEKAKPDADKTKQIQERQSAEELPKVPADSKSMIGSKAQLEEQVKLLAKENHRLTQRKMCRACRKVDLASSGVTFLPCGHFITCEACSEMFDECPACGKSIMGTVRTFLS